MQHFLAFDLDEAEMRAIVKLWREDASAETAMIFGPNMEPIVRVMENWLKRPQFSGGAQADQPEQR